MHFFFFIGKEHASLVPLLKSHGVVGFAGTFCLPSFPSALRPCHPAFPPAQNPFQFRVTRKTRHWSREFNRFFSIAGNKWFDWDQRLWDRPKFLLSDETAVSDCNSCFFSLILLLLFPKLANETSVLSFLSVQTNQSFLHSACKNTSWAAASPELLMCVYI